MCCITADRSLLLNEFWKGSRCLFLTPKENCLYLTSRQNSKHRKHFSVYATLSGFVTETKWKDKLFKRNTTRLSRFFHSAESQRYRLVWKLSDASSLNICIKLYTDTSNVDKKEVKFKKCRDFSVRHIRPPISTNKREQPCFCLNNCSRKLSVTSEDVFQVLVGVQGSSHRFMQSCY